MTLLQASLFDSIPLSIPSDNHVALAKQAPPTSVEAARRVMPTSGTQRMRVLRAIAEAGEEGVTDHQIAARTGLVLNSVNPRRNELVEQGWICDSTKRRECNGRRGIVWVLTPEGERRWAE